MKKSLIAFLLTGVVALPTASLAGLCTVKSEAESVKEPLPVKYQKVKAENEQLKSKLESCKSQKESIRAEISRLEQEISYLEGEKAQLEAQLNSLPNKWELQAKIDELQQKLGR
ncbi:hypothetical protein [Thermovibrio sp.]